MATIFHTLQDAIENMVPLPETSMNFVEYCSATIGMQLDTPAPPLPAGGVNFELGSSHIILACDVIARNYSNRNEIRMFPIAWECICSAVVCGYANPTLVLRNSILSILITMSRFKLPQNVVQAICENVENWRAEVIPPENVPTTIARFLNSNHIQQCFQQATNPYYTADYRIPPTIIVVYGAFELLHGWVCCNDCIAVNATDYHHHKGFRGTIALASLIAHEIQHGIVRKVQGNFFTHTPNLSLSSHPYDANLESGYRLEGLIWKGEVPNWKNPLDATMAATVAEKCLNDIINDRPFPSPQRDEEIDRYVGRRPVLSMTMTGASLSQGMDIQ